MPEESKLLSIQGPSQSVLYLTTVLSLAFTVLAVFPVLSDQFLEDSMHGQAPVPLLLLHLVCLEMSFTNDSTSGSLTAPPKADTDSSSHAKPPPTPSCRLLQALHPHR